MLLFDLIVLHFQKFDVFIKKFCSKSCTSHEVFGTAFVRLRASAASADFTNSLLSDTSSLYYKLWPRNCCQSWLALYLNSYRFTLLPLLYLRLSCFFFFCCSQHHIFTWWLISTVFGFQRTLQSVPWLRQISQARFGPLKDVIASHHVAHRQR